MASKPNPSWTQPQKDKFSVIMQATEIVIPYFGQEIPVLDNHSTEQVCDQLGLVKIALKAFEKTETILKERFKVKLNGARALRTTRFEANIRTAPRIALNQSKVQELLQKCDDEGIDLLKLVDGVIAKEIRVPSDVFFPEDSEWSNQRIFNSETEVDTLTVKEIK